MTAERVKTGRLGGPHQLNVVGKENRLASSRMIETQTLFTTRRQHSLAKHIVVHNDGAEAH